ncbi:PBECR4 domain-containing protein [Streptococcus pluranimalium]|uniref:PBECR4 domain-containing protein n=1 Tax=Streptococcus pluranimalium TaxID=82348 RepID=UPI003F6945FE
MVFTKAQAKSLSILEVARSLGMEMKRISHKEYYWTEHKSFKIDTVKNTWNWYSHMDKYGDTIGLVQEIKGVSYREAMHYLEKGTFPEAKMTEEIRQPFRYTLAPYEQPFNEARQYLKEERGLSDDTIDFFLEKGVLAQARRKDRDGFMEDVLVFKYLDQTKTIVGASLQGLTPYPERHEGKGYLKQIMYQSEGIAGLNVSIGSPRRLIVAEAPIDLMSYYELHKDQLEDVRLVAMEGLKEGIVSRYAMEALQEQGVLNENEHRDYTKANDLTNTSQFLATAAGSSILFHNHKQDNLITLAVDNDKAGTNFIERLREKKIPVIDARPPKGESQDKMDWNDCLKQEKAASKESYRLTQAKQKLDRLKQEASASIDTVYRHAAKANGQPMNDKRSGAAYLKRQEQLEAKVSDKLMAIKKQEERVDYLEQQERFKAQGLNRRGTGLEMSVQNIPRIREELEKADRGESFYTKATLKRYRQELERLEGIADQVANVTISPVAQKLIDDGLVTQWAKQPNLYFVKGLHRVALELNDDGVFQESSKYQARTPKERERVNQLLETQLKVVVEEEANEAPVQQTETHSEVAETVLSDNIEETITEHPAASPRQATYKEIEADNKALSRRLQEKIQAGDLVIHYADDAYFSDVFNRLGNSHPTKLLTEKRLAVLKPLRKQLETIRLDNVDAYKEKGTPEQDYLYNEMKPLQRQLGTDISTRFIGELAIAAYNINNELQGLQADTFGTRFYPESTLEMFSQTIGRIIEYPLIEAGVRTDYNFVTTPNAFLHYLNNQSGEVIINKEMLDSLIAQIKDNPIEIMSETKEQEVSEAVSTEAIKEVKVKELQQTAINEKALEETQRQEHSEQQKKERIYQRKGSLQPEAEGSTSPVLAKSTFERSVTSRPTVSSRYLNFTIKDDFKSRKTKYEKSIDAYNLGKLNRRSVDIQEAAQFYLNELANSTVHYFTLDGSLVQVNFLEENFLHLTGLKIIGDGATPEKVLHDFANGGELSYDDIRLKNTESPFDKIKVLPDLETVLQTDSFYFDKLQGISRYEGRFDSLIKSDDSDLMLLFRMNTEDGTVPVSVFKARQTLIKELQEARKNEIVGIFRERDGIVEQIAINQSVVKDGGKEMKSIIENGDFDPIQGIDFREEEVSIQSKIDSDGDGISDEEELKQGTNPYDFRSTPSFKATEETSTNVAESIESSSGLAIANFIKNKDVAGLNRHLKAGIKDYLDSEKYKDYLIKMSQLNNYSSRNLRLILAQNPKATQVASFKQWKETFERHVKKGEKSLRIFAPITKLKKDENNHPILDKNGKPETVTFFTLVPVFDVSQTDGKEMPKAISEVNEQLTDLDYANLYRSLMAIAKANDVSVRFEEMVGETKGYYNPTEHQIVLRSNDINKSQLIKIFLHETAHSELHHANNPQERQLTRSTAELQAESVAYVVSAYYGLDTSGYSFGYLASWSDDKETLADLEAQLDIVQQEAKSLMVRMDQHLEQLRLAQEKQNKHQFEQKLQKFKDQNKQAVEEHKQELKQEAQSKKEKGLSK